MLGRSGRPQYDKTGHGIVITQHSELQHLGEESPVRNRKSWCLFGKHTSGPEVLLVPDEPAAPDRVAGHFR